MKELDEIELSIEAWTSRIEKHLSLVGPVADAFLKRRDLRLKHPVHDFLFTYYSFSPQKLKQWVPSLKETLIIKESMQEQYPWFNDYWFKVERDRLSLNKERFHKKVQDLASYIVELCSNISNRAPRYGCYGLHEWAMVYKLPPELIRHSGYRLRLSPSELSSFVESQSICCSHYDAYRFFTQEARPLNMLKPGLENKLQMEQGGCVHANMDLYKWSSKLWPWIGSDFIGEAFMLALQGRELDMRASPYDLNAEGYEPICIETEEGRREYQKEQQLYAEKSALLRDKLKKFCEWLIISN